MTSWNSKHVIIIIIIIIIIQPLGRFWQEPEPSQAIGMALARCILGKFLGVVCHCFPLPLDIPTFAARYLHVHVHVAICNLS
jgi:ABC-type methionine transport system permease subunit